MKKNTSNKTKAMLVFGCLLFRVILDLSYRFCVTPSYAYYGDLSYHPNSIRLIFSYVLAFAAALFTPYRKNSIVSVFLYMQLVLFLYPMLTLYGLSGRSLFFTILVSGCHVMQSLFYCIYKKIKRKKIRWTMITNTSKAGIVVICGGIFLLVAVYVMKMGLHLEVLNFNNVYGVRRGLNISFPFNYLIPWFSKVVTIFMLVYGINKKNKTLIGLSFVGQLIVYLGTGHKSMAFSFALALGCCIAMRWFDITKCIVFGLTALVGLLSAGNLLTGNVMFISLIPRRSFFTPATIRYFYYEFFLSNQRLHLTEGVIGKIMGRESPYPQKIALIIGDYMGTSGASANTGYWGDAYANFGAAGVVVFSLVLFLLLTFIDNLADEEVPPGIAIPFMLPMLYTLNDSALLTCMLTGGALLAFVVLELYGLRIRKRGNLPPKRSIA